MPSVALLAPEHARTTTPALNGELHQWITADEVAALLKVRRSWVYEHTRSRKRSNDIRLPFVKIGKYVRFNPRVITELLEKRLRSA